ncbi:hypothetical protein GON26_00420 [Flavobacterium sp. GA093]|uniref:Uncharacterized protein n=1 Tax=Flavobacterium hydrocarbonoxydans TaxID=2683249 RepID=A0A6I4NMD9_9FLAO|nr:hypothetical protein [Flavobacterium hydrocarbonoxydans]MWB92819.1 hypothetical protein [Flavobacterium hydrocarbonoxydans]
MNKIVKGIIINIKPKKSFLLFFSTKAFLKKRTPVIKLISKIKNKKAYCTDSIRVFFITCLYQQLALRHNPADVYGANIGKTFINFQENFICEIRENDQINAKR